QGSGGRKTGVRALSEPEAQARDRDSSLACASGSDRALTPGDEPLLRLGGLALGGLALAPVVLALELLDAARGVHVLHLAGEERVTGRADFDRDVLARAARDELVAAAAGHRRLDVFRVNAFLHDSLAACSVRMAQMSYCRTIARAGEVRLPAASQ